MNSECELRRTTFSTMSRVTVERDQNSIPDDKKAEKRV